LNGIVDSNGATVISFFSGGGGLDLGLLGGFHHLGRHYPALPFRIVGAYDHNKGAVETYRLNIGNHVHQVDLGSANMRQLPSADVLIGGFPCQSFSVNGNRKGLLDLNRGQLYLAMVDYMATHQPKIVIGENVPFLAKMDDGAVLAKIISDLEQVGYRTKWSLFNLPDFGLPSRRQRIIITCVRSDIHEANGFPDDPTPSHLDGWVTIDGAIDDLIAVTDETIANQSQFCVARRALGGQGQGDETSQIGKLGYLVRANGSSKIHFHYKLKRRLTVREAARLQGFPDEFVFPHAILENFGIIGNAVPPIFAHHLGKSLADYLGPQMGGKSGLSTSKLVLA
jgi:DNA (cytosine-5)-methyltransferase 1